MKRILFAILVCVAGFATPPGVLSAIAARPALPAAPDGDRFLFVADISEDMERLKAANEAALYDLLLGGLYGQMRDGDSYGIWMFNKETYTGRLPMQVWESRKPNQLAAIAAAVLSGQNYEKSSDVKQMMTEVATVIHSVSNVTVFIISDGSSGMHGTPFDKKIADEYKKKRRERNTAKRPFVTMLIARDGRIADYSVVVAGQPIQLPPRLLPTSARIEPPSAPAGILLSNTSLDRPVSTASVAPTQSPTNSPALIEAGAAAKSVASTNLSPANNVIAGGEAVPPPEASGRARRAAMMQFVTKSNSLPAALNSTSPTPAETNALASDAVRTEPPATAPSAQSPPITSLAAAPPLAIATAEPKSKGIAAEESFKSLLPATITAAAREVSAQPAKPEAPGAIEATALPSPRSTGENWMLTFAVVLLALVLMLLLVVLRRLRPTPGSSLITQSMERR